MGEGGHSNNAKSRTFCPLIESVNSLMTRRKKKELNFGNLAAHALRTRRLVRKLPDRPFHNIEAALTYPKYIAFIDGRILGLINCEILCQVSDWKVNSFSHP